MIKTTCIVAGVSTTAIVIWMILRQRRKLLLPDKWQEVGVVSDLIIYPLKSGHGLDVRQANATRWGLAYGELQDRCFLVVMASTGTFVTGRQSGKLLGVLLTFSNSIITLHSKGAPILSHNIKENLKNPTIMDTRIWGEPVRGIDCGDEAAEWLSNVLYQGEEKVRLLYKGDVMKARPPRRLTYYDFPQIKDSDTMYYADTSAFLITSQSSLDDLNHKLTEPIKMSNFRPNIVVSGVPPFQEDEWIYIKIGKAVFRTIKPCERCLLTTMDPDSGERHPNQEPLQTLRSYRLIKEPSDLARTWATKPVFGCHMFIDMEGHITIGDKVFVATASENPGFSIFNSTT